MRQNHTKTNYLAGIHSPADLRALPRSAMPDLAREIREFLIEKVGKSGGHLASNLGVVELTLALHRVFDTPTDHIIWDVGHQSYVHKILTGRADRFDTLRQVGGLSGFTSRRESEYDPFGAGHSSTSVSAALGFAEADRLSGKNAYTVAVVGDGAYTGGMIHEAINNCPPNLPLILVLNENEMSISRNTGAFAGYIARIRASRPYKRARLRTAAFLKRIPLLGNALYRAMRATIKFTKRLIYKSNYFEDLGFLYLGPIDGHNYDRVERALLHAKERGGAVVVHVKTQKGMGYSPAEENPCAYHSMSGYHGEAKGPTFHSVFGEELTKLAKEDKRITAITAAMGLGCGLEGFRREFPERFFDVGIAEEHATTFAAGMAANGSLPCFAVYSTFLQRAYDNVLHDVALQNLPVKFFIDRAGLATGDGATHHGIFDVSYLSGIPNLHLYAPACYGSMRTAMRHMLALPGPAALRYAKGGEDARIAPHFYPNGDFENFGVRADFDPQKAPKNVVITYGSIASEALYAQEACGRDRLGILLMEELKPYEEAAKRLAPYLRRDTNLLFLEEGIESGSAAACTLLALGREMRENFPSHTHILAIRDHFASPSEPCNLYRYCGISSEDILEKLV
ncbi:MAG: 1-deoxy-D-xylulose-5-phosphate synthase [Clostridia bacterium]|nr:1-deoxy-D-xylulose-5-phosphate synthase [Clostridia bacterium]